MALGKKSKLTYKSTKERINVFVYVNVRRKRIKESKRGGERK